MPGNILVRPEPRQGEGDLFGGGRGDGDLKKTGTADIKAPLFSPHQGSWYY